MIAPMLKVPLHLTLIRIFADGIAAAAALVLFYVLPFGMIGNVILSALAFVVLGAAVDRWYLARLTADQRAAEMQARVDSDP
jgi:riboflavin transporter FmnP